MLFPESISTCTELLERLFPFSVFEPNSVLRTDRYPAVEAWCIAVFGTADAYTLYYHPEDSVMKRQVDLGGRWCYGHGAYRFKTHTDATEFKLRWG